MRAVKGNLDHSLSRCVEEGGIQLDGHSRINTGAIPRERNEQAWREHPELHQTATVEDSHTYAL
jgi:hypothetical protein